jgi:hypothetical protein
MSRVRIALRDGIQGDSNHATRSQTSRPSGTDRGRASSALPGRPWRPARHSISPRNMPAGQRSTASRSALATSAMGRRRRASHLAERVCCLARQAAGGDPGRGNRRSAASHCRSRSRRTERCRAAARLWPRLNRPMTATRQLLHPTPSGLTRNPTRDITPTTRWVTPPRPPSDRNGGRFQIGMGGRFQIGIPGRLRRNPHSANGRPANCARLASSRWLIALIAEAEKLWPHSSSVIALTFRVETPCTYISASAATSARSER